MGAQEMAVMAMVTLGIGWKVLSAQKISFDEVLLEVGPKDWVEFGHALVGQEGLLPREHEKVQQLES